MQQGSLQRGYSDRASNLMEHGSPTHEIFEHSSKRLCSQRDPAGLRFTSRQPCAGDLPAWRPHRGLGWGHCRQTALSCFGRRILAELHETPLRDLQGPVPRQDSTPHFCILPRAALPSVASSRRWLHLRSAFRRGAGCIHKTCGNVHRTLPSASLLGFEPDLQACSEPGRPVLVSSAAGHRRDLFLCSDSRGPSCVSKCLTEYS